MFLPTPITMPGTRRIKVGNHSCLTISWFTNRSYRNMSHGKHPSFDKRSHGTRTFDLPIPRRAPYPLGHSIMVV
ncbi:hypothetical protein DPMN_163072 [Dreissena polymorpha]|uniref:Uncharacterized protein n=1 Tax=Dreissena polymorpha TaxID=45954 RepID=A0A9D4ERF7_DREPO|nr:hypothetical protein DPMN_163072 [Dreissena polymorpha]